MSDHQILSSRRQIDLSAHWTFSRGRRGRGWLHDPDCPDSENVSLPHSWNRTDTFQSGVRYYQGVGSYCRSFACPPEWQNELVWLCSEGFYGTGRVWVNGRSAGRVNGQFLGFRLPVDRMLEPGAENEIICRLTNRCGRRELPGIRDPDFLLHGGLAGRVWLEATPRCYLDNGSLYVETRADPSPARVQTGVRGINTGSQSVRATIVWSLLSRDGEPVTDDVCVSRTIPAGQAEEVSCVLTAPDVTLWSDQAPHLYQLRVTLRIDDAPVDTLQRRIGFRHAVFREGEGFFLNGERVLLRGCNRHENMPGCGNALSIEQHRADAAAIREMGLNFVRLSHYPQSPAFLDACDEMGILVYAELASWKSVRGGSWLRKARQQFAGMIRRDHHHPAVILWGMGNEGRHRQAFLQLRLLAQQLDSTRPVIYAENHLYRARRRRTIGIPDVWGCNYELDALQEGSRAARLRTVVVSECSNWPDARRGNITAERQQIEQLARDLPRIEKQSAAAGFAIWCLADYATLRKSRYLRYSGVLDAWREPKLAAFWLRARYSRIPFVKLAADWHKDVSGENSVRRVDVFMNLENADVKLNDRTVASVEGAGHHVLELPFEPGPLAVVARDVEGISDTIMSYDKAARLALSLQSKLPAVLRVEVLDQEGHLVRNWDGHVALTMQGGAQAFPYIADRMLVAGGCGRVPIAADASQADATWHVAADNLQSAHLTITDANLLSSLK